ncbi:MAG: vitamin K epoxide reductase family protein [Mycobacteriales bacterium]
MPLPEGPDTGAPRRVPAWLPVLAVGLALAGLGVAGYLTAAHYTEPTLLACPEHGLINCTKVTTSAQSRVFGVPVALLGLLFYAAILPLQVPAAWRARSQWVHRARLAAVAAGMIFVLYLVYTELFTLDAICLYCTAVHVITLALFTTVVIGTAVASSGADPAG